MSDGNLLYTTYKDAGRTALFIVPGVIINLVDFAGILLNLFIIYLTIKYSSLRGTSSFLLAFTAFCEVVHEFASPLFLWIAISGQNFLPYSLCFKFVAVQFLGASASQAMIVGTGFDRLFQIIAPKIHGRINQPLYLSTIFLVSLVVGIVPVIQFGHTANLHSNEPTTGAIKDVLIDDFGPWYNNFIYILQGLAIAFYVAIWIFVQIRTASSPSLQQHAQQNARFFRSLVMILLINIGSYLSWAIANTIYHSIIVDKFKLDQIDTWCFQMFFSILLHIGVALNAPVLYHCSSEYKKCFQMEIAKFRRHQAKVNVAQPITIVSGIRAATAIPKFGWRIDK